MQVRPWDFNFAMIFSTSPPGSTTIASKDSESPGVEGNRGGRFLHKRARACIVLLEMQFYVHVFFTTHSKFSACPFQGDAEEGVGWVGNHVKGCDNVLWTRMRHGSYTIRFGLEHSTCSGCRCPRVHLHNVHISGSCQGAHRTNVSTPCARICFNHILGTFFVLFVEHATVCDFSGMSHNVFTMHFADP